MPMCGSNSSCRRLVDSRLWRLAIAELLRTFLLVSLGLSAAATAAVSAPATAQMGSGLALIVALYVTMGASGGHINPAVSTALFVIRRMKLGDYLVYQAAQYAGGFLASGLVCCFFYPPLLDYAIEADQATAVAAGNDTVTSGGSGSSSGGAGSQHHHVAAATAAMEAIYVTHAHQSVSSVWRPLVSEIFATGAFILAVRAITDRRNAGPPLWLQPPMISASVLALTKCTAPLSGCALNPARDLPSRVVVALFQLASDGATTGLFGLGGNAGFVAPLLGPYLGAAAGSWLYELCIARGLQATTDSNAAAAVDDDDDDDERMDEKSDSGDALDKKATTTVTDPSAAESSRRRRQRLAPRGGTQPASSCYGDDDNNSSMNASTCVSLLPGNNRGIGNGIKTGRRDVNDQSPASDA